MTRDPVTGAPAVAAGGRASLGRSTRQKRALADLLDASPGFRSAQDLHAELRNRGETVGLTTVYNQLRALAESGEVDSVRSDEGETLYRRCGAEHHHHLVCRHCGRTVEVQGQAVERWAREVARANGYVDIDHTFEIVGSCRSCSASGAAGRTAAPGAG